MSAAETGVARPHAIAIEPVAFYVVWDNPTLNVPMIVGPLDAIEDWQQAAPR